MDMYLIFLLITILLMLVLLWIFTNIYSKNKIMFKFIRQAFIVLSSLSVLLATNCIPLNNEPYIARPTLIDWNSSELHYYLFMFSLGRYNWSCNILDGLSGRICLPKNRKCKFEKYLIW